VSVYRPGFVTIVSESNCGPCHRLLTSLKALKSTEFSSIGIQVLWTDKNRNDCAHSALKVARVAENYCISEVEVERSLGVKGTPSVFWKEGGKHRHVQGADSKEIWRLRLSKIAGM
jgi:hypothetical protein